MDGRDCEQVEDGPCAGPPLGARGEGGAIESAGASQHEWRSESVGYVTSYCYMLQGWSFLYSHASDVAGLVSIVPVG